MKVRAQNTNPEKEGGEYLAYDSPADQGKYHMIIESVEGEFDSASGNAKVVFEVLAPEAKAGRKYNDFFGVYTADGSFSSGMANRCMILAIAAGLLTHEQWQAAKEADDDVEFDEQDLVGRSVCMDLKFKPAGGKQTKPRLESAFNIFSPFDEKVKDFPKCKRTLATDPRAKTAKPPADKKANGNGSSKPASPPEKTEGDGFGDMFS